MGELWTHLSGPTHCLIAIIPQKEPEAEIKQMISAACKETKNYLWVIHESSSSVNWPDLNISQPAWAIIAPLSMQNLGHKMNSLLSGLKLEHNVLKQPVWGSQQWGNVAERKEESLPFSHIYTSSEFAVNILSQESQKTKAQSESLKITI